MKIKYKDFLKTFNEKQIHDIENYYDVIRLHKEGFSRGEIKQKVNVSINKLHYWRLRDIKPISIKILEETESRGYFKNIKNEKIEWLSYLIGYNLGDGNISRNFCNSWFYGVNTDLEDIKEILLGFNVEPVIYTYKINNGKMAVHDRIFSRFLTCFGAVVGDKTINSVRVPEWILKTRKASKIKRRFLQGFFDSELSDIKQIKNRKLAHQDLKIYTSKVINKSKFGVLFLNQIRFLLNEFNILSSDVKLDRTYFRKRDKNIMQQLFFYIYPNYINLFNFIKNVGFLHNSKRRENSLIALERIKDKTKKELDKIAKYEKALELRKEGLSAYEIAKILSIETYNMKNWIYWGRKPRLYNFVQHLNSS